MKDLSKLDPYVKIELLADEKMKRQTKTRKNTGANVIWNEILSFPTIEDNLAFVRYDPRGSYVDEISGLS